MVYIASSEIKQKLSQNGKLSNKTLLHRSGVIEEMYITA